MSIPLREGFVDETLERCLEDLLVRFVVNCPEEDLSSIERVLFQIEEAHWFYQDFLRTLNPLLPSMKMKQFTNTLIAQCPLIWKWGDPSEALAQFGKYKSTIPVRGCALLTPAMDKILLVKGIESSSWGFPRGKISKDESDVDCALRELEEETGFDATDLIDEDAFVERTIKGKNYKIYIVKNVPEDTVFSPKVRCEIVDIQWKEIKQLSKAVKTSGNYYLVGSMLKSIISYIKRIKNNDSEQELKRLATIQLKKILGINEFSTDKEEYETADPGRALLSALQSSAKGAQVPTELEKQIVTQNQTMLQQYPQQFQQPQQLQQQLPVHPNLQGLSSHPFMSPNLLSLQQNRMIPAHSHNPFALQMFNPYMAPFGVPPHMMFNNPPVPPIMGAGVSSQSMQLAPSASTFSKPQFSLANKRQSTENSKELLSILKSKPKQEQKKSNSIELLNILRKEPVNQQSSPSSAPSSAPVPIRILKREKPPTKEESKLDSFSATEEKERSNSRNVQEPLDITEPANKETSRDISKPLSSGKPIVLLRKNSNISAFSTTGTSKPETKIEPLREAPSSIGADGVAQKTKQKPQKSLDNLSLLNMPNPDNIKDPSAELLNILKNSPATGNATPANSTPGSRSASVNASSDPSRNLLDLLKSKPTTPLPLRTSRSPELGSSKDLLDVLKGKPNNSNDQVSSQNLSNMSHAQSGTPVAASPDSDPSKNLLDKLRSTPRTPVVTDTDPSKDLLNMLKSKPTTHNSPVPSQSADLLSTKAAKTAAPNTPFVDPSKDLLSLLKDEKVPPVSSVMDTSDKLLSMLKSKNDTDETPANKEADSTAAILEAHNQARTTPIAVSQDELVDLLKNAKKSTEYNTTPNHTTTSATTPSSKQSACLLSVLKGPSSQNVSDVTFNDDSDSDDEEDEFQDFEDFDDVDDIEGEYILNGGLYADD